MTLQLMTFFLTLLISLSPAAAFNITVQNDQALPTMALFVVVYDMNTRVHDKVLDRSIDPGNPASVEVTSAEGKGHIRWEAQSNDRQRCGFGEERDLSNGAEVSVRTPNPC